MYLHLRNVKEKKKELEFGCLTKEFNGVLYTCFSEMHQMIPIVVPVTSVWNMMTLG